MEPWDYLSRGGKSLLMTLMKESSSEKRKNVNRPQDILMSFKRRKAEENDDVPEESETDNDLYKPCNVSESDDKEMNWDVNSFSALTSSCNTEKIEEERPRKTNFDNEENLDLDYRNLNNPDYETQENENSEGENTDVSDCCRPAYEEKAAPDDEKLKDAVERDIDFHRVESWKPPAIAVSKGSKSSRKRPVPRKKLRPPCTCKMWCSTKINEERRASINKQYWMESFTARGI